jgi:hypothetical protein
VTEKKSETAEDTNKPTLLKESDSIQIIKDGEVRNVKKKKLQTYLDTGWGVRK